MGLANIVNTYQALDDFQSRINHSYGLYYKNRTEQDEALLSRGYIKQFGCILGTTSGRVDYRFLDVSKKGRRFQNFWKYFM